MSKKMLLDASHPEELRVAVVSDKNLDEFECETSTKKPIRGNIYLARVVRIEPSLQAAFVDFGRERHGFLAFNEIHPDYYRIPVEDQAKLLKSLSEESQSDEDGVDEPDGEDVSKPRFKTKSLRSYKIQEVVKKRQVLLIQVVKEERGGKGAALTTYLSLPGRYCVLMPNTPRGTGVSRKIGEAEDRKKLKEFVEGLDVIQGAGLIVRTAGLGRTKVEIKRDYDYLARLWEEIREKTLISQAPSLIYEEGNLITKSIRDLYGKDIDEIWVEGEAGYKQAKNLMKIFMPSHAKKVQLYKDTQIPLFHRYNVEQKIDNIHHPVVRLPSGGYVVINPTEALVSIDVNSGRATRERHIEETALKTNMEAAAEIARQLRLRDLAGLIVIDFIDMDHAKHNTQVERAFREAVKIDRARIQLGAISAFGLLEMSRQRLRASLSESISMPCEHCQGTGVIRSIESSALQVLRALEVEGVEGKSAGITVSLPTTVAFYLLNHKRVHLGTLEEKYNLKISVVRDDTLHQPDFSLDRVIRVAKLKEDVQESGVGQTVVEEAVVEETVVEGAVDTPQAIKSIPREPRSRSRRAIEVSPEASQTNGSDGEAESALEVDSGREGEGSASEGSMSEPQRLSKSSLRRHRRRRADRRRNPDLDDGEKNLKEHLPFSPSDTQEESFNPQAMSGEVSQDAPASPVEETSQESAHPRPERKKWPRRRPFRLPSSGEDSDSSFTSPSVISKPSTSTSDAESVLAVDGGGSTLNGAPQREDQAGSSVPSSKRFSTRLKTGASGGRHFGKPQASMARGTIRRSEQPVEGEGRDRDSFVSSPVVAVEMPKVPSAENGVPAPRDGSGAVGGSLRTHGRRTFPKKTGVRESAPQDIVSANENLPTPSSPVKGERQGGRSGPRPSQRPRTAGSSTPQATSSEMRRQDDAPVSSQTSVTQARKKGWWQRLLDS